MSKEKLNALELVNKTSEKTGLTKKDTRVCIDTFLSIITEALSKGQEVTVPNYFGKFKSVKRKERMGRNPQTEEVIKIPAYTTPVFRPGKTLKDAVRNKK